MIINYVDNTECNSSLANITLLAINSQIRCDKNSLFLPDEGSLNKFVGEVEAYVKHVEGLTKHTLSGPTPLDKEWRVSQ